MDFDHSSTISLSEFHRVGAQVMLLQGYKGIGVEKTAQTITGINFFPSSGTLTEMEISVYGVK